MNKEYHNGLGIAYRGLEETANDLEDLWNQGEIRLSPEQIKHKLEALNEMVKLHKRIKDTLTKFSTIAPPARQEPPQDSEVPKEPQE